jgi:hypothetical protein
VSAPQGVAGLVILLEVSEVTVVQDGNLEVITQEVIWLEKKIRA